MPFGPSEDGRRRIAGAPFASLPANSENPVFRRLGLNLTRYEPAVDEPQLWRCYPPRPPPSVGTLGFMELRRHWLRIPAEKRRLQLMLAREMAKGERAS